jgi:hypothetical protein
MVNSAGRANKTCHCEVRSNRELYRADRKVQNLHSRLACVRLPRCARKDMDVKFNE